MITVLFFASIRDSVGMERFSLTFSSSLKTIDDVVNQCKKELPKLTPVLIAHPKLMFALNQEIVRADAEVKDGDEVALLPPLTGG